LKDQGLKAKREAQAGDTDALALLRAVQTKTQIEVETSMHMGPAMNTANLITAYSINNKFPVIVAPRFGIWQGHKMVITKEGIEVHFLDAQGKCESCGALMILRSMALTHTQSLLTKSCYQISSSQHA